MFSALKRNNLQATLASQTYDLVVIGGGITGSGIALDAQSRGLKTALVEKEDFAAGTSSRSTKLIHGGLRYLKQFEIALVREVGLERAIVHKLAPHLVTAEKMLLPLTKNGTYGKMATSVGLFVYDVLAGVEKPDQRIMLSKEETLAKEPLLEAEDLEGGGYYAEYRTDDARLTIEVVKTAVKYGASCINYTEALGFEMANGLITGLQVKDHLTDQVYTIKARYVVSAAGPWVDTLRKVDNSLQGKKLHLTKGVHVVVPYDKFPVKQAIYFDVPDGRMIFAIPRGKITYIGTTDTNYHGDIDRVTTHRADAEYLIDAVNNMFPRLDLKIEDIVSSWAGLRPLIHEEGKSASELSRKDEIFESATGLISIAGGKLTGYRKMAERIVDLVVKKVSRETGASFRKCHTDTLTLQGGEFGNSKSVQTYKEQLFSQLQHTGLDRVDIDYLVANYGKQTDLIINKYLELKRGHDLPDDILLGKAELYFAIHHEFTLRAEDFFIRRTGYLYFDIDKVKRLLDPIIADMAASFGWDKKEINSQKEKIAQAVYEARDAFVLQKF
jgi:glycerol-3-phosphate dehydrogenase